MTSFLVAFLFLALLLGVFAYVAVPAASRGRRVVIAGFFAVILGTLFFGYSDMLGRPKSTRLRGVPRKYERCQRQSAPIEGE